MRNALILARPILALMALFSFALGVRAADGTDPALPTFAQAPPSDPSPWTGLYAGSELSFSSGKGGGIGGGGYIGYNHELSNNVVIGIQGTGGYAPSLFSTSRASGYNYAGANVKVGYDMGRFMPFVTAGVAFAKPNQPFSRYTDTTNSLNDLFNSGGHLQTLTTVGAGFDYRVNNNLSMELSVSASQAAGGGAVWPAP